MKKIFLMAGTMLAISNPAFAQEEVQKKDQYLEMGAYLFAAGIKGDSELGNAHADLDVSFSDILENLDAGFMGYSEYHTGDWSFIGDLMYTKLSADGTPVSRSLLSINVDAELEQIVAQGFVGYRVYNDRPVSVDILGGARFNQMKVELGAEVVTRRLTIEANREREESWTDGVVGTRIKIGQPYGWGAMGWADVGQGSDSSSYQLAGFGSYTFKNDIKLLGGYRFYHSEYEKGSFEIDTDLSGPMVGVSYRF